MKKILLTIILTTFMLIWMISLSSAACIVQGYTKDNTGKVVTATTNGLCYNTQETISDISASDGFYYLSFGGPADSCSSRCGDLYVNSSLISSIPEQPELVGYAKNYPMNQKNTPGWNDRYAHNVNLTLSEQNHKSIKNKPIISPSPKNTINSFNVIIKKEQQKRDNNYKLSLLNNNILFWFLNIWDEITKLVKSILY